MNPMHLCADCVYASLGGRLTSVMQISIGTAHFRNSTFQQLKPRGRKTGAITLDDRAELAVDSCTFDPNNGGSYVIGLFKSTKVRPPSPLSSVQPPQNLRDCQTVPSAQPRHLPVPPADRIRCIWGGHGGARVPAR